MVLAEQLDSCSRDCAGCLKGCQDAQQLCQVLGPTVRWLTTLQVNKALCRTQGDREVMLLFGQQADNIPMDWQDCDERQK